MSARPLAAAAAVTFSLLSPSSAQAPPAPPDGNELYIDCTQSIPTCSMYLLGVWDGLVEAGLPLCPGGIVTAGQLRLVYLKFGRDNPAVMARAEADTAVAAFILAFPCRKPS